MTVWRRLRITDVAAQSGVGVGTVSQMLNGSPQVRESTRARVLETIGQIRYRPSRPAADLSRVSPARVAIVVPFLTRPVSAVQKRAPPQLPARLPNMQIVWVT